MTKEKMEGLKPVDPGQGYRLLVEGDRIEDGDEVWSFGEGPWEKASRRLVGRDFENAEHHPVRRRLDTASETAPELLEALEAMFRAGWDGGREHVDAGYMGEPVTEYPEALERALAALPAPEATPVSLWTADKAIEDKITATLLDTVERLNETGARVTAKRIIDAFGEAAPVEGVDLEVIEAREKAATPGPWGTSDIPGYYTVGEDPEVYHIRKERDDNFIAHARQDIPALIAEVRRLRAALSRSPEAAGPVTKEPKPTSDRLLVEALEAARRRLVELNGRVAVANPMEDWKETGEEITNSDILSTIRAALDAASVGSPHPWDLLQALKDKGEILCWEVEVKSHGTYWLEVYLPDRPGFTAHGDSLGEAVDLAVKKLPGRVKE